MPVIAVVNRKGGSGKSTLATHLAAYCANNGIRVMLGDVDRQQSSQAWLKVRGAQQLAQPLPIVGWTVDPSNVLRRPSGVTHVVLDTPGGMRGFDLARVVMSADAILMPLCNSVFDRDSAAECFAELKTLPRIASGRCQVAAVGMRIDARTKADEVLRHWAERLQLPFIGVLRETQAYVRCIERGLTLFDLPAAQVATDMAQWQPILQWLDPVLRTPSRSSAAANAPVPMKPATLHATTTGTPLAADVGSTRPRPLPVSVAPARAPASLSHRVPPRNPPPASAPSLTSRIGRLIDSLPLRRFLQREP